jgi:Ca2+-binding EF-hand superfamily protein
MLDEKLKNRELTASELREMKDIFNLKAKDQDIRIEMVDFSKAYPEEFDIINVVMEHINRKN